MTSMLPRPLTAPSDDVLISALPRPPSLVGPPSREDVVTSALPHPPIMPVDDVLMSALPRPSTLVGPPSRDDVVTSALPRPLTPPADFTYDTVQRPADCVDNRNNVCTHSVEQFPPPPPVYRQPVPLLPDHTQATASAYVNTDPIPVLSAHRYADNYQNISANMSLPPLSTHTNVPTHVNAPMSQAVALGQLNVTDVPNLYAASYASNLNSSGLIVLNPNIARSSYADHIQPQPIAVEQPACSTFSRTDVPYSQSATVQYTVGTSVSTSIAPLQSPSVHWRKRLAYDYIQPDTGLGAPTHAAPAVHSGYIRPQTSDTHTHTFK